MWHYLRDYCLFFLHWMAEMESNLTVEGWTSKGVDMTTDDPLLESFSVKDSPWTDSSLGHWLATCVRWSYRFQVGGPAIMQSSCQVIQLLNLDLGICCIKIFTEFLSYIGFRLSTVQVMMRLSNRVTGISTSSFFLSHSLNTIHFVLT